MRLQISYLRQCAVSAGKVSNAEMTMCMLVTISIAILWWLVQSFSQVNHLVRWITSLREWSRAQVSFIVRLEDRDMCRPCPGVGRVHRGHWLHGRLFHFDTPASRLTVSGLWNTPGHGVFPLPVACRTICTSPTGPTAGEGMGHTVSLTS